MRKHRLESLSDGIFAVAMTLLVIELKLPDAVVFQDSASLVQALGELTPKFISWVISFLVLAFAWWGNSRALNHLHVVDGKLVFINLLMLAAASLMPFASALSGTYVRVFAAQVIYSTTMLLSALAAYALWRYIHMHPELCDAPMTRATYRAARVRTGMLVAISVAACVIGWFLPGAGNSSFMLMAFVGPVIRYLDRRDPLPAAGAAA